MMVAAESTGYKVWNNNKNKVEADTLHDPEHDITDLEVNEDMWSLTDTESDRDSDSGSEEK